MLNQKIIKNIFFLIPFIFLYNFTVYGCAGLAEDIQKESHYKPVPALPKDMLVCIFEIGQKDRNFLKKLRVACKLFSDMATKLDAFFFKLNSESLHYYKRRPYASVRIHAKVFKDDPIFFEKAGNDCLSITSLAILNPSQREYNKLKFCNTSRVISALSFNFANFVPLTNLQDLTIRNRIFVKKDFYPLMLLTNLTSLDLTGAHFYEFNGINYMTRLCKLKTLILIECVGERSNFSTLSRLTSLTELNVRASALPEKKIIDILTLTQLRKLNIDGNMYEIDTFEGIEHLTRLTKLEILSLDGDIAMAYRNFILSLTNLKRFIIDGTTCDPKEVFSPSLMSKSATM